jgi:hypothetical protein
MSSAQLSVGLVDEDEDDMEGRLLPESPAHVEAQQEREIRENAPRVDKLWQVISDHPFVRVPSPLFQARQSAVTRLKTCCMYECRQACTVFRTHDVECPWSQKA